MWWYLAIYFTISDNHRCLDLRKFDNALVLVFAPLLFLLLYIEIPQNSSIIQHTVLLSCIEWMIIFFDIWCLLNVYHQFMYFSAEELLEMWQCSDSGVCTAITLLKIMVSLVYGDSFRRVPFIQTAAAYKLLVSWLYTLLLSTFSGVWLLEIRQSPSTSVRTTIILGTIHRYIIMYLHFWHKELLTYVELMIVVFLTFGAYSGLPSMYALQYKDASTLKHSIITLTIYYYVKVLNALLYITLSAWI